ncbi:hypothetical protein HDV01_006520 [Terramyces sp. JEL0728]|nr:hypothetical protein HDV01_006520 [Terramyces sp. JEL0728]
MEQTSRESASKKNKEIEDYLKKEKKEYNKYATDPKVLILGSSDSGKSTLLKQLKIIYGKGFGAEEKEATKALIRKSIWNSIITLINESKVNTENSQLILKMAEPSNPKINVIPLDVQTAVLDVWNNPTIQTSFEKSSVPPTLFMPHINRIYDEAYIATDLDILNLRTVTQNVSETVFVVNKENMHFFDVSGLLHHRKVWLNYFDNVNSVLFVISLAAYDQVLVEDEKTNRMVDSIELFHELVEEKLLAKPQFILFMNKKDLYEQKVKKSKIVKYFPDYEGKAGSVSQGINFFKAKFTNEVNRSIFTHVTCCTDTSSMKIIIVSTMY